jgi:AraC-like DNA-binding protein
VPLIRDIIAYTDENFLEKITIDELAFLFNTNRATLCKEFKRATGKTLISYIANKKTELAKKIIANSEITFTEVAERLNFESVHYFTRFFKKETGMTPKEYRLNEYDAKKSHLIHREAVPLPQGEGYKE